MESVLGLVRHSGNEALLKAIEMSLLATASGQPLHLHAEGLRGTGKTTVMRAVRRVLPRIRRIKECLYNCDPAHPHCPRHRGLTAQAVESLGDEWVPMPFLEISHSAKVGTVVGSIDLQRLVSPMQPEAALLPGTVPQAHRGIIFVDEINRLAETAPELADILLDVMGTKPGRIQIEETGLPAVELPVQVTVWAASNPDEDPGPLEDIRRQLSDRFDFVVYTDRPGDAAVVEAILDAAGDTQWHRPLSPADEAEAESFRADLDRRVTGLRNVHVPQPLRQQVADLYSRFNVESLRAVQAIQLGMRLAACLEERGEAKAEDLARIAPLALRHRVDGETIKKVSAHLAALNPRHEVGAPQPQGRPRFPGVNFGAAVVEPAPGPLPGPAAAAPAAPPVDKPARAGAEPERREYLSTSPTGVRQEPQPAGWLNRTLAGLKRNFGFTPPSPALRPEPRATGRPGAGGGVPNPLTAPRPGRLFQQASQESAVRAPNRGGAGESPGAAPGQAQPNAGESASRPAGAGGAGRAPGQVANPLDVHIQAPPKQARPLRDLLPHEFIRTEEELGRR